MTGINMQDPDGVRKHGTRFREAGELVHTITDRMNDLQLGASTLGGEWHEQGAAIREALPKLQEPWRRLGDLHHQFGNDLHDSADLVQGVDQERAERIDNTDIPPAER